MSHGWQCFPFNYSIFQRYWLSRIKLVLFQLILNTWDIRRLRNRRTAHFPVLLFFHLFSKAILFHSHVQLMDIFTTLWNLVSPSHLDFFRRQAWWLPRSYFWPLFSVFFQLWVDLVLALASKFAQLSSRQLRHVIEFLHTKVAIIINRFPQLPSITLIKWLPMKAFQLCRFHPMKSQIRLHFYLINLPTIINSYGLQWIVYRLFPLRCRIIFCWWLCLQRPL